jgi:hypothetical protein
VLDQLAGAADTRVATAKNEDALPTHDQRARRNAARAA